MTLAAIALDHVSKRFGQTAALEDVSFQAKEATATALLGPNGAGKTTSLRIIVGLIRPDRGLAKVGGRRTDGPMTGRDIGACVDRPSFYPYLSGLANLRQTAAAMSRSLRRADVEAVAKRVNLDVAALEKRVSAYSTGMRLRLAIACALVGDPPVVVLDEPTSGLDPEGVVEMRDIIRSMTGEGRSVLISSHALGEVEATCSDYAVLDRGRVVSAGSLSELLRPSTELIVTLTTEAEATRAHDHLTRLGWATRHDGARLAVAGSPEDGPRIARALAEADIFAVSMRQSEDRLESAYLRLLGHSGAPPR